ncbi:NAD(P)/FAD-dependent oxidoreductase [Oceaniovalibus sp. ACAM 378]|uniref:NAD(P)/FAD-dependent oxidoreductase n=1 Tax=Oceaniovalibus sp. ACAM 378 TaxID=2599923 RepID=UPI0011D88AAD|nr:NAD(P)/FAD-dependent oxidoreductase [Oceaniovalibus sp. ACAM 378]TYB88108.1 NAD(P)/FAD-dependent oxidoreductase [Oceaniovalibus sp. ACAM 378]
MEHFDTLILGAGAAGMMCAAHAGHKNGKPGGGVLIVDHARAPGEKIRISGGGRCNFTNLHTDPAAFLSANPHFCKSALSRYTQWDFLDLVARHSIPWHEKTLGQLFCDHSAKDIIAMLLAEMSGANLWLKTAIRAVRHDGKLFTADLERDGTPVTVTARHLVLATGGKSIPKMGATGLAYTLARQFGVRLTDTRPGLVPLTFGDDVMARFRPLAGVAAPVRISAGGTSFDEAMLFTHRGLSGPAVLQASSYWHEGEAVLVDLSPGVSLFDTLRERRTTAGRKALATHLGDLLPARLAADLVAAHGLSGNLADCSDARLRQVADLLHGWELHPSGTEGYRTAEVTLGGIDTGDLDSRTMECRPCPGLFAIGEAVDVTGWLGGYNFQWAWSSGWAAGRAIAERA